MALRLAEVRAALPSTVSSPATSALGNLLALVHCRCLPLRPGIVIPHRMYMYTHQGWSRFWSSTPCLARTCSSFARRARDRPRQVKRRPCASVGGHASVQISSSHITDNLAKFLANSAFVTQRAATADVALRQRLKSYSQKALEPCLRETLPHGVGVHHAGLAHSDKCMIEDAFLKGDLCILVSTSSLSVGVSDRYRSRSRNGFQSRIATDIHRGPLPLQVNLPAHMVVIKGTQLYQGQLVEYSRSDVRVTRWGWRGYSDKLDMTVCLCLLAPTGAADGGARWPAAV